MDDTNEPLDILTSAELGRSGLRFLVNFLWFWPRAHALTGLENEDGSALDFPGNCYVQRAPEEEPGPFYEPFRDEIDAAIERLIAYDESIGYENPGRPDPGAIRYLEQYLLNRERAQEADEAEDVTSIENNGNARRPVQLRKIRRPMD